MRTVGTLAVAIPAVLCVAAPARLHAQTCAFNQATATATVSLVGGTSNLRVRSGSIELNNAPCGGATVTNTDTVVITATGQRNVLTMAGDFAPGATPEAGLSEIEVSIQSPLSTFTLSRGGADDAITFTATGIDVGDDGDEDVSGTLATPTVRIMGGEGNDTIDATRYPERVVLYGNGDNDTLVGGPNRDTLFGGAGDDLLDGGLNNDSLSGGPGTDDEIGGAGNDLFRQDGSSNGSDTIIGGGGIDKLFYNGRRNGVTVTIGDGLSNDGEPGEGDNVGSDIENLVGGAGNDTLTGSSSGNVILGGGGNDTIFGLGGNDTVQGDAGDDFLNGGSGRNQLKGKDGNDTLQGDPLGTDTFKGDAGDDTILNNTDGRSENVFCGTGTDTAEDNDEDNFVDCE
jgi:Ca2+-binding RTX toxin-like protein